LIFPFIGIRPSGAEGVGYKHCFCHAKVPIHGSFQLDAEFTAQTQLGHGKDVLGDAAVLPFVDIQFVEKLYVHQFAGEIHVLDIVLYPAINYRGFSSTLRNT